jgi:transcriptional regulator with XRE-family HTH domain
MELKAILEDLSITITECAKISGMSYHTLRKWAAGEREPSDHRQLRLLADALGLESTDYLYMTPQQIKIERGIRRSKIHKGVATINDVTGRVPQSISEKLTADEYAELLNCINRAYHDGKASAGAEMIDKNAVWVDCLNAAIEWDKDGTLKMSKEKEPTD